MKLRREEGFDVQTCPYYMVFIIIRLRITEGLSSVPLWLKKPCLTSLSNPFLCPRMAVIVREAFLPLCKMTKLSLRLNLLWDKKELPPSPYPHFLEKRPLHSCYYRPN